MAKAKNQLKIEQFRIDDLATDPHNAKRHPELNIERIRRSLRRFGQRKPIVVGRNKIIQAGNGTYEAAKAEGWETIWGVWSPLKGEDATAYSIADNRSAELAEWDNEILADLLQSLSDEAMSAAGYEGDELQLLIDRLTPGPELKPEEEWEGMPEYVNEDQTSHSRIIVHFKDEEDRKKFGVLLQQSITDKTRSIWYPFQPNQVMTDVEYADA